MSVAILEPVGNVRMVTDRGEGKAIHERRTKLGLSVKALAALAGVDRGRLAAIEDGASARSGTYGAIHAALDKLEEEMSGPYDAAPAPAAEQHTVTLRASGNFGVDVTVEGPIADIVELEASVIRLIGQMQRQDGGGETSEGAN